MNLNASAGIICALKEDKNILNKNAIVRTCNITHTHTKLTAEKNIDILSEKNAPPQRMRQGD